MRLQNLCEQQVTDAGNSVRLAARARGWVRGEVCRASLICSPVHNRPARSYIDFRTQTKRGSTSARVSQRGNSALESFLRPTHVRWPSPLSESQDSHPPSRARFRPANLGPCARFAEEVGNEVITDSGFTFCSLPVGPSAVLIGRPGVFGGILDVGSGNVSLLMVTLTSEESVS